MWWKVSIQPARRLCRTWIPCMGSSASFFILVSRQTNGWWQENVCLNVLFELSQQWKCLYISLSMLKTVILAALCCLSYWITFNLNLEVAHTIRFYISCQKNKIAFCQFQFLLKNDFLFSSESISFSSIRKHIFSSYWLLYMLYRLIFSDTKTCFVNLLETL